MWPVQLMSSEITATERSTATASPAARFDPPPPHVSASRSTHAVSGFVGPRILSPISACAAGHVPDCYCVPTGFCAVTGTCSRHGTSTQGLNAPAARHVLRAPRGRGGRRGPAGVDLLRLRCAAAWLWCIHAPQVTRIAVADTCVTAK